MQDIFPLPGLRERVRVRGYLVNLLEGAAGSFPEPLLNEKAETVK
jgi:hypothetical protein